MPNETSLVDMPFVSDIDGAEVCSAGTVIALVEFHSKMAVYWDEIGAFRSSLTHQLSLLRVLRYCGDTVLHPRLRSVTATERVLLGLYPRSLVSTMSVHLSHTEAESHRRLQLQAMMRLYEAEVESKRHRQRQDAKSDEYEEILTDQRLKLLSIEQSYTSTPASMMIGYEGGALAQSALQLLSLSNALRTLVLPVSSVVPFRQPSTLSTVPTTMVAPRIRVGFISSFFYDHSVGRLMVDLICGLDRGRFEVVIVVVVGSMSDRDPVGARLLRSASTLVTLSQQTGSARSSPSLFMSRCISHLRGLALDIVVYPEIGMDHTTLALASVRLAPLQLAFWGHPIPQGLENIDYYVSSDYFERSRQGRWLKRHRSDPIYSPPLSTPTLIKVQVRANAPPRRPLPFLRPASTCERHRDHTRVGQTAHCRRFPRTTALPGTAHNHEVLNR